MKNLLNRFMVGAGLMVSAGLALADDPFTAAVTDATSKVSTYGAALVALAAAGVGFGIGVKYVKKIRGVS